MQNLNDILATGEWKPDTSTSYGEACRIGRELGRRLVEQQRCDPNPAHFSKVMQTIIEAGVYSGVEIGLFTEIALAITHDTSRPAT